MEGAASLVGGRAYNPERPCGDVAMGEGSAFAA